MKTALLLTLLALLLPSVGCVSGRGFPPNHQIVNFDWVVPGEVARGGQLNRNSVIALREARFGSIIDLKKESESLPGLEDLARSTGMAYYHFPLDGLNPPDINQLEKVVSILEGCPKPVFIGCVHGCERTGICVAAYRVSHGWSPKKALQEADYYDMVKGLGWRRAILHLRWENFQ